VIKREESNPVNTDGDMRHLTSEDIQDLLDQELSPSENARVREHLSSCVRCRSEMEGWSLLFSELGTLPDLAPGPAFSRAVLERLSVREPVGARVRGWLAARVPGRTATGHLSPEGIQEYLDQLLPGPRRVRVEAHLASCASCRQEVEGWEAVFGSLDGVERLAPPPGFPERVMARVRIPAPAAVSVPRAAPAPTPVPVGLLAHRIFEGIPVVLGRALALARHVLPRTRRGWAIAGGVASAPTITLVALLYLVFSRPLLTAGAFLAYASWKVSALLGSMVALLGDRLLGSATLFRLWEGMQALAVSPLLLGFGGVVFSLLCAVALRVLHRNLLVAPSNEGYAHVRV
jgi:anti-sigma factor RsiW